uniref:Uncharacterized protein n=1 Tax=Anguilla anguilla TaxID=7936 RepID=A0A0E9SZZ1_ANGAN
MFDEENGFCPCCVIQWSAFHCTLFNHGFVSNLKKKFIIVE